MKRHLTKIIAGMLVACMALVAAPFCAYGTGLAANSNTQTPAARSSAAVTDIDMVLVFDVSGSMDQSAAGSGVSKLQSAKNQVNGFFVSMLNQNGVSGLGGSVRSGVVSFADNGKVESGLTSDDGQLQSVVNSLHTGDMTNMYEGLALGMDMLESTQAKAKIIVLLSDGVNNIGHSDDEIRALARQAAQEGIVIYSIGFGPASTLDEDLLKYLANETGGQYAHEDSSDIYGAALGIYATMMQAQMAATGQTIVAQSTGAVSQGETAQLEDMELPQSGTLVTYLYWPGSLLTMKFVDPNNVEVTPSYPGYTVDDSVIPTKITIQNAMAGIWKRSVTGTQVSMDKEPFYTVSSLLPTMAGGGGGGGPVNGGMMFVFLIAVVGIGAILLTYAMSRRKAH